MLSILGLAIIAKPMLYFGLFMRGDGPRPKGQAELQAMQDGHINNLKRLHGEGKLLAAGPLEDPTKKRRGILVIKADSPQDIPGYFTTDPYVQGKIMTVKYVAWQVDPSSFATKLPDPDGITEYRIVFAPATTDSKRLRNALIANSLTVVGGPSELNQVFLVHGATPNLPSALGQVDLKIEVVPLWMTPGILKG